MPKAFPKKTPLKVLSNQVPGRVNSSSLIARWISKFQPNNLIFFAPCSQNLVPFFSPANACDHKWRLEVDGLMNRQWGLTAVVFLQPFLTIKKNKKRRHHLTSAEMRADGLSIPLKWGFGSFGKATTVFTWCKALHKAKCYIYSQGYLRNQRTRPSQTQPIS